MNEFKLHWAQVTDKGMDKLLKDLFLQDFRDQKQKKEQK